MLSGKTVGFLGAGNMVEALIRGMIEGGVVQPHQIIITNRGNLERLEALQQKFGVRVAIAKADLINRSDVVVIACKPKDAPELMEEVGGCFRAGQVLLSVMAGISTAFLESALPEGVEVVRSMPNTSAQVGESATAIALGSSAGIDAALACRAVMGAVGVVEEVAEPLIDAVTGVSGSGPAYFYYMVEAMIEAGVSVGLTPETARALCIQTIKGAARMLDETGEDPAVLRQKVTSPGGTTQAGLTVMAEMGFPQAIIKGVARATQRSREMGVAASWPRTQTG